MLLRCYILAISLPVLAGSFIPVPLADFSEALANDISIKVEVLYAPHGLAKESWLETVYWQGNHAIVMLGANQTLDQPWVKRKVVWLRVWIDGEPQLLEIHPTLDLVETRVSPSRWLAVDIIKKSNAEEHVDDLRRIQEAEKSIQDLSNMEWLLWRQYQAISNPVEKMPTSEERIEVLENFTQNMERLGSDIEFSGLNIIIRSQGVPGLGNLLLADDTTTVNGMHNLVIGNSHQVNGDENIVMGFQNQVEASNSFISGMNQYAGPGDNVFVGGGFDHVIQGFGSAIIGGKSHTVEAQFGTIIGGEYNEVLGNYGSVFGGTGNRSLGEYSVVAGGAGNIAFGERSSVFGGRGNSSEGLYTTVSGGYHNTATGNHASVSGGRLNTASGGSSSVSGGRENTASGNYSSVSSGRSNLAKGEASSVTGGRLNEARGSYSSASGGYDRLAIGYYDWVAGTYFQTRKNKNKQSDQPFKNGQKED